jgi:hypothetical protein
MSFANPLFLFGLLAASVPVVIHLIHRRRPRKQPFPAMQLLLRSVQRVEKQWRIRRFLLLALRVLLIAALALAAAGPLLGDEADRAREGVTAGPERIAFVIDASLSMRAGYGGRAAFERAVAEARERVDRLGPQDQALIVVASQPPRLPIERPTADRGRLLGVLADLEPGWRPASLSEAVSAAASALGSEAEASSAPPPPARVVVLSDLARPAVDGAAFLEVPGAEDPAALEVVELLADIPVEARENHGFIGASAMAVPGPEPRTVEITARVQSHSPEPEEEATPRDLTVRCDGEVLARSLIEIAPGTLAQKSVRHAFARAGTVPCQIEVEPDVLREDDVRHLSVEVRRQVRTLIVDGDPSGVPKEDEVFYLEQALEAGAADQPAPRLITADDLARTDLEPFDVVILAGVPSLSGEEGERLTRFVQGGGGLLVTAARGMNLAAYAKALGDVLPREPRSLKETGEGRPLAFIEPNLEHPIMQIFEGEALGGLLTTETQGYLLFQPGGTRPMTTLLELEGGAPALVVAPAGQGRVAVLATSIDRDLTDLPIRPAFVPLARQLLLYLGDALTEGHHERTLVGDTRVLEVPPEATRLEVRGPEGRVHRYGRAELARGRIEFAHTDRPGPHAVEVAIDGELRPFERESFAVNVDPIESDLRPVDAEQAAAVLRGDATLGEGQLAVASRAFARRFDTENLSSLLLLLMGFAFLFESALTALRVGR